MPGSEIDLAEYAGSETTRLDFIAQAKDTNGKVIRSMRDKLEVKLKGVTAADLAQRSLAYDTGFTLHLASTPSSFWHVKTPRESGHL